MIALRDAPASYHRADQRTATTRCVVVGAGSIGRRHMRNLAAAGVDTIALRTMQGQSGDLTLCRAVQCWQEVKSFAPTVAIIANPTAMHVDAALIATQLGCHILVEKPVADRVESAMQLQTAVTKRKTTALVGYQFRFHPTLRMVRQWVQDGAIGDVVSAHAHWGEYLPDWHPGENHRVGYSARRELGGGVVLTLSHPMDYLRWILGEVTAVSAMTARRPGLTSDVEDVAAMTLRMANEAIVTMSLDYVERPARHTLHITGSAGTIFWDAATGVARMRRHGESNDLVAQPEPEFERNSLFVEELRHFLACARGEEVPICTLKDGARSVAIAEAVFRAAREGRVVLV